MPAWCNWKTRLTQDQLPYGMKVRDLSQVNMLQWCKWKTRLAKDQMPYGMRVRFSPEAKLSSGGAIGRRSCLKNSFRKNCEFESHPEHHRILAQLELEQPTSNRQVIGSNPICPISGM